MRRLIAPLAVTLFALFAAQPLFTAQLTCSDDSAFHIGRAVMLEQLIDSGHFFPRWSPHMAHGYGYPFFNYYGALSSYLLVALHKLGFIYPLALHIAFGLCLWLAGLSTYAFVREWCGDAAGVVSAVAYITAPYFAYDLLFRGNLAESLALALLPLALFTLHRSVTSKPPTPNSQPIFEVGSLKFGFWNLLASASLAALLYTHNATSLAAAPLFIGYVALIAYLHRDPRALLRGGLILLLGLALSAAFWLPALAEINLVQTDRLLVPPIFTYYTNYLSPAELLAPPIPIDPLLINPSPAKALGLATAILAIIGLIALLRRTPLKFEVWSLPFGFFFATFLLTYAALTLAPSRPLWDTVPLIKFIQFPWRFLGPTTLCAAALVGAGVHWLSNRQWLAAGFIAAVISIGNLSWWYPRYCVGFTESTLADILKFEYDSATIGTTAKGEYLPRTVRAVPGDEGIAQAWMRGEPPQYITGLPSDSTLTIVHPDPLDYRATVTVSAPITLTFNQFFFPGWTATLDNRPADITLTADTGLITVRVPAGAHELRFRFGNTPLRAIAAAISIIALAYLAFSIQRSAFSVQHSASSIPHSAFSIPHSAFVILPLALILLRPLIIDRTINPLRRSSFDDPTITIGQPVNANFSSGLTALSVEFPSPVASGAEFDVTLYAAPRTRIENDYRPRFDVVSADGLIWNNGADSLPPRWHREPPGTQYWPVGQYAQWARREMILPGTPPGDYELAATIFDLATLAPDSVIDTDGKALAPVAALGTIHITRPAAPPDPADLNIERRVDHDFGPITLLGYKPRPRRSPPRRRRPHHPLPPRRRCDARKLKVQSVRSGLPHVGMVAGRCVAVPDSETHPGRGGVRPVSIQLESRRL